VVRICSRTIGQLESTNSILQELLQHNYIKEVGMPLNYAYKMKSLVLFIKPFDANCSEKIESKFKKSGLNFHITVFDVIDPHQKNKNKSQTPDDEPKIKIKKMEAQPTAKVLEKIQQIEESRNATQKDKYALWEAFRTLLLNISSGFVIFVTQIAAIECFIVIYFFQKKFLFPHLFQENPTDTMVEEVQQMEEILKRRQETTYPPWEVVTTILLSMISGFAIFLKHITSRK
jgi:hypothetical protein